MSVVLVLEYRSKPDTVEAVLDTFRRHNPAIRHAAGLESLTMYQDEDDPTIIVEVGIWESRSHHDEWAARWKVESFDDLRKFLDLLACAPARRYCTTLDA